MARRRPSRGGADRRRSTARTTTASSRGCSPSQNSAAAPWLWDGTGLVDGSTFGQFVGGYGIEIDATAPQSPPGTLVVAQIPDLFGPGMTAQMSYYETPAGAKVFAAGTLDFGGSATFWPVKRMLDNLWAAAQPALNRANRMAAEPDSARSVAPVEVARARPEVLVGGLSGSATGSCGLLGLPRDGARRRAAGR